MKVWDAQRCDSQTSSARPLCEYSRGEHGVVVRWHSTNKLLTATTAGARSYVRMHDVRQATFLVTDKSYITERCRSPNQNDMSMTVRAVHGLTTDPHDFNAFLTYASDGQVSLWDMRSSGKPLTAFNVHTSGQCTLRQVDYDPLLFWRSARRSANF